MAYVKIDLRNIISRRKELKMSQKELAAKCGLSIASIQGYEHGKFVPKKDNVVKICQALDLPIESVLHIENVHTYSSPLEFEIAWLRSGGCRNRSKYGRQASAIIALEKLTDDGQEKALELLDLLVKIPEYQK